MTVAGWRSAGTLKNNCVSLDMPYFPPSLSSIMLKLRVWCRARPFRGELERPLLSSLVLHTFSSVHRRQRRMTRQPKNLAMVIATFTPGRKGGGKVELVRGTMIRTADDRESPRSKPVCWRRVTRRHRY